MKDYLLTLAAAAGLLTATTAANAEQNKIDPDERLKIEAVLENYLMKNPEIVMKALRELQRRQTLARMLPAIEMYRDYLENEPDAPVLGNPDGDVTIVEFFDYRCGFCKRHFPSVMKLLKEDGNIRLIPRQFPILDRPGETALSFKAASAALAAHKQGKFEEFHLALMGDQISLTEARIYEIAQQTGLNVPQLKADMNGRLIEKTIKNTLAIGQDIGFEGTPGYIVANDVILGAEGYNRLIEAVARARQNRADASAVN